MDKPEDFQVRLTLAEDKIERNLKHHVEVMEALKEIQKSLYLLPCEKREETFKAIEKRITGIEDNQKFKTGLWIRDIVVASFVGGLVARLAPDAFFNLVETMLKVRPIT